MENKLIQVKNLIEKSLNISSYSSLYLKKKKKSKRQIIPNEILFKIFSYCDINTLFHSIPYVSHQWNSLLKKMSFAGQINLKIYDDQQFKKLFSKMISSSSRRSPYSLPASSSYGNGYYSGYSGYGSYGGLSDYDAYSSYSNYNSYGNYNGYGSYNGFNDFGSYNNFDYGSNRFGSSSSSSSSNYSFNKCNKEKEVFNELEPNYKIKLLESKKTNPEVSMPVVFQIDLSLPLSFITVDKEEDISNGNNINKYNNYNNLFSIEEYSMMNEKDNNLPTSSSSTQNSFEGNNKEIIPEFDLEPIQDYLAEKQKEITQFKAFYYINGIEISIDSDKIISNSNTTPNQAQPNNVTNNGTLTSEPQISSTNSLENELESRSNLDGGGNDNIQNASSSSASTSSSSAENDDSSSTQNPTNPPLSDDNDVIPLNKTMILIELFLEKYRFTPEILKIQNVQWSEKFVHMVPKSVKEIDIKYLGNPDADSLKNGTDYLHSFIKNISISSSSILRPRTRRINRFYHSSVNRASITVN